ncbi:hypothetical protein [Lysobacter sp. ESA13C]|uniref:hypothetical protein n=1 Tax=Lysobacter sp. ESA13C TaxID=2862676 RepID=UPI001CC03884|nr:hypothetical protein [Lysobacter sp. ESA13C]
MKERPIPFLPAMVRAVLDGTKTQTRRLVKPQPKGAVFFDGQWLDHGHGEAGDTALHCPYGVAGDRLWVREPWRVGKPHDKKPPRDLWPRADGRGITVLYEAGGWRDMGGRQTYPDDLAMPPFAGKYRPSMFMLRAFSRITLEVTGVRVERLQDISAEDCIAEGIECFATVGGNAWRDYSGGSGFSVRDQHSTRSSFRSLWTSTGGEWDANSWVWVVEFKRVDS